LQKGNIMLIIGGLFIVAFIAVVSAIFLAREDTSAPDAQKAGASEQKAAKQEKAVTPVSEVAKFQALEGRFQALESRVNRIAQQVELISQGDEQESSTFVDIPAISHNRHP
jgi:hypothetical protein